MRFRLLPGGRSTAPVCSTPVCSTPVRSFSAVHRPGGVSGLSVGSPRSPTSYDARRQQGESRHLARSFFNEFFSNDDDETNGQGVEEGEDKFEKSNFVPLEDASSGLDGATEQTFGPLAILAAGLAPQEFASLKMLMNEMGADEVKLIGYSRRSMGDKPLGQVLEAACAVEVDTNIVYDAEIHIEEYGNGENNKPVAFLSGMYQSEIIEVVTALRYCDGLPDMAFAALVPNNYGRDVEGLIGSVYADHQAVAQMRAQMSGSDTEGQ